MAINIRHKQAEDAIKALVNDQSISNEQLIEALEELKDDIEMRIESLEN